MIQIIFIFQDFYLPQNFTEKSTLIIIKIFKNNSYHYLISREISSVS